MYIDFTNIATGEDFELLCEDLLDSMGFFIESKVARGPDLGRDILAIQTLVDKAGISETHRYLIECKHNAVSGKSVLETDIGNPIGRMGCHNCNRYILITSTVASEKVRNQLNSISNIVPSYKATIWSKSDLRKFLDEYPGVTTRHFNPISKLADSKDESLEKVKKMCKEYLELPGNSTKLQKLLLQYPEFLPIEKYVFFRYEFRTNVRVPNTGRIDCIAARPDTSGIRGYIYYFGSPYDDPFMESGEPKRELTYLLDLAHKHASIAIRPLSSDHVLHPAVVTGLESAGMKQIYFSMRRMRGFGAYGSLNIFIIIGQRNHHTEMYTFNQSLVVQSWKKKNAESNETAICGCDVRLEILSYSRLISLSI